MEKKPYLIKVFGSPHPLFNLIAVIPLGWFFLSVFLSEPNSAWIYYVMATVLSWFFWTFFEYALHRWVYHGKIKNSKIREFVDSFHIYHHLNIDDPRVITAGPMMILFFSLFLIGPLYFIFPENKDVVCLFGFAVLVNYYFYEWVHHLIHKSDMNNRYMKFIRDYHMYHHDQNWKKNFGNTTSFWDHLLGTYENQNK